MQVYGVKPMSSIRPAAPQATCTSTSVYAMPNYCDKIPALPLQTQRSFPSSPSCIADPTSVTQVQVAHGTWARVSSRYGVLSAELQRQSARLVVVDLDSSFRLNCFV
jgi:hypothetical protein